MARNWRSKRLILPPRLWIPPRPSILRGRAPEFERTPLGVFAGQGAPVADPVPVKFNGTDIYLNRGAGLTGASDGTTFLCSFWFRSYKTGNDQVRYIWDSASTANFKIFTSHPDNFLSAWLFDTTTQVSLSIATTQKFFESSKWNHALISADSATDTIQMYINDSAARVDSPVVTTGNTFDFTDTDWIIGRYGAASQNFWRGELADLYLSIGHTFFDLSTTGNRRKFIGANGRPVYLGANGSIPTGSQPIVYLNNPLATWQNNLGSGGNFTENGTLLAGEDFGPGTAELLINTDREIITQNATTGGSGGTLTFTMDFGTAFANRRCIVVGAMGNDYETGGTTLTIGGVSATVQEYRGTLFANHSFDGRIFFAYADVSSGNGELTCVLNGATSSGNGSAFFHAYTVDSSLLVDGSPTFNSNETASGTSLAVTLNTGANGFLIGSLVTDQLGATASSRVLSSSTDPMVVETEQNYINDTGNGFAGFGVSRRRATSAATPSTVTFGWSGSSAALAALMHWK